jgi:hypothetical protein
MMDGAGDVAVAAYHHSIREQEERRQLRVNLREITRDTELEPDKGLVVRIHGAAAQRPDAPFDLDSLVAIWKDGRRVACQWSTTVNEVPFRVLPSNSLETVCLAGRECLRLREHGDVFHELNAWLYLPPTAERPTLLEIEYSFAGSADLSVSASVNGSEPVVLGLLPPTGIDEWSRVSLEVPPTIDGAAENEKVIPGSSASPSTGEQAQVDGVSPARRYGTAEVTIEVVRLVDETGNECREFHLGCPMRVIVEYHVRQASAVGEIVAAVSIHRDGSLPVVALLSPPFRSEAQRGVTVLDIEDLRLGPGQYLLTVGLFRPEMWSNGVFYTISPDVYDHRPHAATFAVTSEGQPAVAWIYVQKHTWRVPGGE